MKKIEEYKSTFLSTLTVLKQDLFQFEKLLDKYISSYKIDDFTSFNESINNDQKEIQKDLISLIDRIVIDINKLNVLSINDIDISIANRNIVDLVNTSIYVVLRIQNIKDLNEDTKLLYDKFNKVYSQLKEKIDSFKNENNLLYSFDETKKVVLDNYNSI